MGTDKRSGQDRRAESLEQIATLVATRTGTLALYAELAGGRPFSEEKATARVLQRFCQALIDYTASAHFQLYRHIDESQERRSVVLDVSEQVYTRIMEITDYIVKFNDKYENFAWKDQTEELAEDLSALGEMLADRIQLEDRVIQAVTSDRRDSPHSVTS